MSHVLAANATTTVPASPGCWANSETAVKACCSLFGGVRIPLPDSDIPGCAYNAGAEFTADNSTAGTNSTSARWADCVEVHFDATTDGTTVLSTCQDSASKIETVTSTPSSTGTAGTSGASPVRTPGVILMGLVAGSALVHILGLAI